MFKYAADEVCLSDNDTVYGHDCKKNAHKSNAKNLFKVERGDNV